MGAGGEFFGPSFGQQPRVGDAREVEGAPNL